MKIKSLLILAIVLGATVSVKADGIPDSELDKFITNIHPEPPLHNYGCDPRENGGWPEDRKSKPAAIVKKIYTEVKEPSTLFALFVGLVFAVIANRIMWRKK